MNDGGEIGSDLVVSDGVLGGPLVQADLQKQVQRLLAAAVLVLHHHFFLSRKPAKLGFLSDCLFDEEREEDKSKTLRGCLAGG